MNGVTMRGRHVWKRILIGFVGVVLVLALGLVGWIAAMSRDIKPPDVSDVSRVRMELPPEKDAFTHFARARSVLVWPEGEHLARLRQSSQAEYDKKIREVVDANAEALRHLAAGLACESCLGPQKWTPDSAIPSPHLAQLLNERARLRLRSGTPKEAVAACADTMRFGDLLTNCPNSSIWWFLGASTLIKGSDTARLIANDPRVSEADLVGLLQVIDSVGPLDRGLELGFKGDFMIADHLITSIGNSAKERTSLQKASRIPTWVSPLSGYLLQPNRCRLKAAEMVREEIHAISLKGNDPLPEIEPAGVTGRESKIGLLGKPNALGRILLETVACGNVRIIRSKARCERSLRGARLVVALRLFEKRTGKLPSTLDELVPTYLPSVPLNPWDGMPFVYDPEKRLVRSASANPKPSGSPDSLVRNPEAKENNPVAVEFVVGIAPAE